VDARLPRHRYHWLGHYHTAYATPLTIIGTPRLLGLIVTPLFGHFVTGTGDNVYRCLHLLPSFTTTLEWLSSTNCQSWSTTGSPSTTSPLGIPTPVTKIITITTTDGAMLMTPHYSPYRLTRTTYYRDRRCRRQQHQPQHGVSRHRVTMGS